MQRLHNTEHTTHNNNTRPAARCVRPSILRHSSMRCHAATVSGQPQPAGTAAVKVSSSQVSHHTTVTHTHMLMRPVHRLDRQRQRAQRRLLQHRQRQLVEQSLWYVVINCGARRGKAAAGKGSQAEQAVWVSADSAAAV